MPDPQPERQLRITCGAHEVVVYPKRFSAQLSALVRQRLGKGPRNAYLEWDNERYFELDTLAELVLIGHLQAGVPMTLAEAQAHPIIAEWDDAEHSCVLEDVPTLPLEAAIVATALDTAPDPKS